MTGIEGTADAVWRWPEEPAKTSTFKGFCNAGEAVFAAWLLERWFGRLSTFGDLWLALKHQPLLCCLGPRLM